MWRFDDDPPIGPLTLYSIPILGEVAHIPRIMNARQFYIVFPLTSETVSTSFHKVWKIYVFQISNSPTL